MNKTDGTHNILFPNRLETKHCTHVAWTKSWRWQRQDKHATHVWAHYVVLRTFAVNVWQNLLHPNVPQSSMVLLPSVLKYQRLTTSWGVSPLIVRAPCHTSWFSLKTLWTWIIHCETKAPALRWWWGVDVSAKRIDARIWTPYDSREAFCASVQRLNLSPYVAQGNPRICRSCQLSYMPSKTNIFVDRCGNTTGAKKQFESPWGHPKALHIKSTLCVIYGSLKC